MSDWDFLHEMRDRGYGADDIAMAAGVGYAPWEEAHISRQWIEGELKDQSPDPARSLKPKEPFKSRDGYPYSVLEQAEILADLVDCADRHFRNTGRYLQVWGELGEIYAEVQFGLRRHETHRAGSDGTIDGRRVEVKTISPERAGDDVVVKSQGDFEQLLIVRIDNNFAFSESGCAKGTTCPDGYAQDERLLRSGSSPSPHKNELTLTDTKRSLVLNIQRAHGGRLSEVQRSLAWSRR
jgi:hypothetical protein